MKILSIDPEKVDPEIISVAAEFIKSGRIVAFPSDSCYGLAADPYNKKAIKKIFEIKNRPKDKKISVIVKSLANAKKICKIDQDSEKILKKYLPGPFTFILKLKPDQAKLDKNICAGFGKISIRIPDYRITRSIVERLNQPITATSANLSGQPEIYNSAQFEKLPIKPDLLLDAGELPQKKTSTIVDLAQKPYQILRIGEGEFNG